MDSVKPCLVLEALAVVTMVVAVVSVVPVVVSTSAKATLTTEARLPVPPQQPH